jgi:hypothetical protein
MIAVQMTENPERMIHARMRLYSSGGLVKISAKALHIIKISLVAIYQSGKHDSFIFECFYCAKKKRIALFRNSMDGIAAMRAQYKPW